LEKGEVITVTQSEEGGWWEGTLNGRTGWFPSTYVTPVSLIEDLSPTASQSLTSNETQAQKTSSWGSSGSASGISVKNTVPDSPAKRSILPIEEQIKYRAMILDDLLESEEVHVNGMREVYEKYLQPLTKSPM